MNEIEKKLVDEFVANANEIERLTACQKEIRLALIEQAPHKRGDVIKWTETGQRKNVGTTWYPKYVDVADRERKGVVRRVTPHIWIWEGQLKTFDYDYEFVVLKKDGSIGVNQVYVGSVKYEWTGEHVDMDNK